MYFILVCNLFDLLFSISFSLWICHMKTRVTNWRICKNSNSVLLMNKESFRVYENFLTVLVFSSLYAVVSYSESFVVNFSSSAWVEVIFQEFSREKNLFINVEVYLLKLMERADCFSDTASCSSEVKAKEVKVVVVLIASLLLRGIFKSFAFYEMGYGLW